MKKVILLTHLVIVFVMSLMIFSAPIAVYANAKSAVCEGAGLVDNASDCTPPDGAVSPDSLIKTGLNIFSAIIGIIAVVMMMLGGVKYIMSQGDAGQVATAKNTILYAAIGLVIVALAQIIVKFVLNRFITP